MQNELIHLIESTVCVNREELHQSEMIERDLCSGIKEAEKMISVTEDKCAATAKRIVELTELEKTEKEQVTGAEVKVQQRNLTALKKINPVNTCSLNPLRLAFATEESDGGRNKTEQEIKGENDCASRGNRENRKQDQPGSFR